MESTALSTWQRGARKGPRPLVVAIVLIVVVVGALVVAGFLLFTSPGVRVALDLFDESGGEISQSVYHTGTSGEMLRITFARTLTAGEAERFRCDEVVPRLKAAGLNPLVVIWHPGGSFVFRDEPCP